MIRRLPSEKRRALDYRDTIAIIGPAIQKGFTRNVNLSAWAESGLCPFTEMPKYADHTQATKGKSVKKNTLNYEVLEWDKPIHPQMMHQIGRGNRLTTGKVAGQPMTDEANVKMFEALDKEKDIIAKGRAANARKKKPLPGDDLLLKAWEDYKSEEMQVKLKYAEQRIKDGKGTDADEKFMKTRLVTKFLKAKAGPAPAPAGTSDTPAPARKPPSKRKKKAPKKALPTHAEMSDSSEDDGGSAKPKNPIYKKRKRGKDAVDDDEDGDDVQREEGKDEGSDVNEEEMFVVEEIRSGPNNEDPPQYEVKWEGYGTDENTWEPKDELPLGCIKKYLLARLERECEEDDSECDSE